MTHIHEEIMTLVKHHPDKAIALFEDWYKQMPAEAEAKVKNALHGKHIRTEAEMNEGLATIVAYNGVHAPFWSYGAFLDVCNLNHIDFIGKDYTTYDVNFLAQYYGADFKILELDPKKCIDAALDKLTDCDAKDDPSEAAYKALEHRLEK